MNIRRTSSRDEQQAFLDYGDHIIDGYTTPPTTDLQSTFLTVQRAMRASTAPSDTMPDHLRTRAWENIMQNAAIAPARGSTRGHRHRSNPLPAVPLPRMAWTGAANIALAVLVLIAGFGSWRAFDGSIGGGNGPAPSGGNYAQAPMTPVPMATADTADVVKSITACEFHGDIPILASVEYSEYKGTALYLWKDQSPDQWATGDLVLRCAGEADVVLASDVYSASPGPMDGIVSLHQYPNPATAPENGVGSFLNVMTGEMISFGTTTQPLTLANGGTDFLRSEWVLGVSSDEPSVLEIANLRTMETRPISEFSNVVPSERNAPWAVSVDGSIVIGFRYPYGIEENDGSIIRGDEMPGDLLVIDGEFENAHWISIPDGLTSIKEAWLAPNGDYLAVANYTGDSFTEEQRSYAILSTADGHLVSQSEGSARYDNASVSWVQDGTAIAFAEQHALRVLPAEDGAFAETLLETEGNLFAPRTTYDVSTVVIQEYPTQDESGADVAGEHAAHIVNIESGEAISIEGRDVNGMIGWIPVVNTLAMVTPDSSEPETATLSFYDAVSGQHLENVDGVPYPYSTSPSTRPLIGKASIGATPDATTTFLTLGSHYMFVTEVVDGQAQVRQLPMLPEPYSEANSGVSVDISDDGSMVSVIRSNDEAQIRFVLDLTDPETGWQEVPTHEASHGVNVSFVIAP